MRRWRLIGGIVLATWLMGCVSAPTYGPIDPAQNRPFGYRDTAHEDGSYTILVVWPDGASARSQWDQRAAELCAGQEVRKNIFRAEQPVYDYTGYASNGYTGGSYTESRRGAFFVEGYLHCGPEPVAEPVEQAPPAPEPEPAAPTPPG